MLDEKCSNFPVMHFGKLHNKLKSLLVVSHIKSNFSMYFARIYHLQGH